MIKKNISEQSKRKARNRLTALDVAKHAGVSVGTVSRVINKVPGVTPKVIDKVENSIKVLGWTPNISAQNIRSSSTKTIGFIFSDIRNSLYAKMTKGAEEVLAAKGYLLITASSDGDPVRELALLDLFKYRRVDGLILTVDNEFNPGLNEVVKRLPMPHVMMERELPIDGTSIGADHYNGTRQAVKYLISLGHKRIAMISGGRHTKVARDRLRGLNDEFHANNLEVDKELLRLDSFAAEYGYRQTQLLLDLPNPPTALLSFGVRLLPGVISAIRTMGYSYPEDISIICSNDTDISAIVSPAITAIRYDAMLLGRVAAETLLDQIEGKINHDHKQRVEVSTEFILRSSCRAISV